MPLEEPKRMIRIETKGALNRFEMTVTGRPSREEVDALPGEVARALATLRPGFVAAIDISEMDVALPADFGAMAAVQQALVTAAPSKVGTLVRPGLGRVQVRQTGLASGIDAVARRFVEREPWLEFVG